MTEQEYLELKEFLKEGTRIANELREQLPKSNKLIIPKFEIELNRTPLTEEQIQKRDADLEILKKLWNQEEANTYASDLIWSYEVGIQNSK